jgi:hypothetical protein
LLAARQAHPRDKAWASYCTLCRELSGKEPSGWLPNHRRCREEGDHHETARTSKDGCSRSGDASGHHHVRVGGWLSCSRRGCCASQFVLVAPQFALASVNPPLLPSLLLKLADHSQ